MFERIGRNDSLHHEVVEYVRRLVEEGKLEPGSRLPTEREMSAKFGVSRTVIRDAVKTLTGLGFLEVKHGVGIFVAHPDSAYIGQQLSRVICYQSDTINNLFEVRMQLETAAAAWAAERRSKSDLELIAKNVSSHLALVTESGDLAALGDTDRSFHLLVAKASGNHIIARLMRSMLDILMVSNQRTLAIPKRAQQSAEEHQQIYRAIAAQNPGEAREAMKTHLNSVLQSLKQQRIV
jgi:GntR family transcriptional repressor for pyruvate dehydrogenase complex